MTHDVAEQKRAADQAIELALQSELVHDEEDVPYALSAQNGIRKVYAIQSQAFKHALQVMFHDMHGRFLKPGEMNEAVFQLVAMATVKGRKAKIDLRVAGDMQCVDIDLGTDDWTMVHVTKDGWSIVPHGERLFRRAKGMQPLPVPGRGGKLEDIRQYLNISDADFPLIVSWLVAALHPSGPYPILWLQGEYGSAKSSVARILRELIDPRVPPLKGPPRQINDLQIAANQSWVIALDNMSSISPELSNEICRITTGGGSERRTLYTTDELTIFNVKRPVIITSIGDVCKYPDLLSRCLTVRPEPIPGNVRQREEKLLSNFNADAPRLFGALLDGVVSALANHADVAARTMDLPRNADAYVWALAAAPELGVSPESIEQAWMRTATDAHAATLEDSVIVEPLLEFLRCGGFNASGEWVGEMGYLLKRLDKRVDSTVQNRHEWPKNPKALEVQLKNIAPSLRVIYGIDHRYLGRPGHEKKRLHVLRKMVREEQAAWAAQDAAAHAAHAACSLRRKLIATNPDLKQRPHKQLANAKYKGARKENGKIIRPRLDPNHAFLNTGDGKICYVCRKRWDEHGKPGLPQQKKIRAVSPPLG